MDHFPFRARLSNCIIFVVYVIARKARQVFRGIFRNSANYSRFLPIANIGRIMKKALPDNAKIAKDAK